jgi:demethylspheroidene O-methyltransferase
MLPHTWPVDPGWPACHDQTKFKKLSIRLDSQEGKIAMGQMREAWIAKRNAILASPRFQYWAALLPFSRPIVRHKAAAMFNIVTGFVYSQVLAACIKTELLEMLRVEPVDAATFGARADLPEEGALRLLKAAASLDLTEALGDGRFALGAQGAALLGNSGIGAMIMHHQLLYADLADPLALLRRGRGKLADYWTYGEASAEVSRDYSALMAATQPMIAEQVLLAYNFAKHRHILDVGGGEGAFLGAVGARHPRLKRTLFDLPAVAVRAQALAKDGLEVVGGSFFDDPLPRGADIVTLIRILHDHDDAPAQLLLGAIAAALSPGDTLLISEPMADTPGARPMGEAYFGFYLHAMGSGRPRTSAEIGAMLKIAGFSHWRTVSTQLPLITRIIVATR